MLDLAETEARIGLTMETVSLTELINEACDLYQALASDNDVKLESQIEENLLTSGNKQFLQRLIGNLLDNAIKYTPSSGRVTIDHEVVGDDVLIRVADTGIGISKTDLPNIFQRFYRCDQSRSKPGTGLGLSLAQAIAKAHWGNISVKSEISRGTQFTITLPLQAG